MIVPKLRFKEFSGEWEEKRLENIGENIIGLTYSPNDVVEDNGTLVLRSSNIKENRICLKDKIMVNLKINKKLLTKENDILICVRNGSQNLIGKNAIIAKENENLTFGAFMTIFRSNYNKFVHQLFQTESYKMQILKNLGARINQITNKNLNSFVFYFPKLEEQQKIADFLSSVDKKISITEEKLNLFKEYKKGMMQKIFSQKIRFKDSEGNDYPEWEEKRLGDIGEIITGKTPSTKDEKNWNGEIQFVTPTDISDNKYQNFTQRNVTEEINIKNLPIGTIMFTCIASIGKMAISTKKCITNQQINSIIVKKNIYNEYIYYALLNLVPKIQASQSTTTLPIINKTEFSKFIVKLPCLEEQQKIADFLSAIDTKIEKISDELENLKEFKKGLLQQMFV